MKNAVLVSTISLLLLGACSSNTGQGGGETGSPIPKEPMPGSPAAEMQKPQTSPANPSPGGGAR